MLNKNDAAKNVKNFEYILLNTDAVQSYENMMNLLKNCKDALKQLYMEDDRPKTKPFSAVIFDENTMSFKVVYLEQKDSLKNKLFIKVLSHKEIQQLHENFLKRINNKDDLRKIYELFKGKNSISKSSRINSVIDNIIKTQDLSEKEKKLDEFVKKFGYRSFKELSADAYAKLDIIKIMNGFNNINNINNIHPNIY